MHEQFDLIRANFPMSAIDFVKTVSSILKYETTNDKIQLKIYIK